MPAHESPLTHAVLTQLVAELAAHGQTVASLARDMGEDRNTLRRWLKGERAMPMPVLVSILETLNLDPVEFLRRARERVHEDRPLRLPHEA